MVLRSELAPSAFFVKVVDCFLLFAQLVEQMVTVLFLFEDDADPLFLGLLLTLNLVEPFLFAATGLFLFHPLLLLGFFLALLLFALLFKLLLGKLGCWLRSHLISCIILNPTQAKQVSDRKSKRRQVLRCIALILIMSSWQSWQDKLEALSNYLRKKEVITALGVVAFMGGSFWLFRHHHLKRSPVAKHLSRIHRQVQQCSEEGEGAKDPLTIE